MERQRNQKEKTKQTKGDKMNLKRIRIIAILLIAIVVMAIAPVSAEKIYATSTGKYNGHYVLVFYIPHNTPQYATNQVPCSACTYRPYIGGIDKSIVDWFVSADHKDIQKWEFEYRQAINNNVDKTLLLIPTSYVIPRNLKYGNINYGQGVYLNT